MVFKLGYELTNVAPEVIYRIGEIGECGGTFTFPFGILTSPSYPAKYPEYVDCVYTISQLTGTAIRLSFLSLNIHINNALDFCIDYLEIRDGPSDDSPILGTFCGNEIPSPILSSQHNLWLK